ncbi:MAG: response regulator transcription factor [Leadbetterella sp.]|jgi:two-component system LytT family response regulator|nr:response regulator transcription factor [Leadbetterella sp.]MBP8155677.1 response regulator transcription factor [Leadbetterella sp.]
MLKIIIIDDEEDARFLLKRAIEDHFGEITKVVGEADNCKKGLDLIQNTVFDLLFLDIKMPDGTGFDLLNKLDSKDFSVVFVTAFDHFAIKAFEFSAVGYLVKPFKSSDLRKTIDRILESKTETNAQQTPFKILLENYEQTQIRKIVLPNNDGFVVVKLEEIIYVNSVRNYSEFHLISGQKVLTSKPLITYENLLTDQGFFRIHHSYLINLSHLKAFVRSEGGAVKMHNGDLLPVSRQKKGELMERFL